MLDGWDGDEPRLRDPKTFATVRQLVTHTSGLGYWFWNADLVRWEAKTGTANTLAGTADAFTAPLVADPGTKVEYGTNTDWLGLRGRGGLGPEAGRLLRRAHPRPARHGADHLPPHRRSSARTCPRCTCAARRPARWEATSVDWNAAPDWWPGGHGLYCPPSEYLRFQRMLLNNGTVDGTKILEAKTVEDAFANQIGDLDWPEAIATAEPPTTADFNAGPGYKFGLGLLRNTEDIEGMRRAGSGAWAGIFNTHFWVDRTAGVSGAIYTQTLPFVEPAVFQVYIDFEKALYASL